MGLAEEQTNQQNSKFRNSYAHREVCYTIKVVLQISEGKKDY